MPFRSDGTFYTSVPPFAGGLARKFTQIEKGLTDLKQAPGGFEVFGTPAQGNVPVWNATDTRAEWGSGGGGGGMGGVDGRVSGLTFGLNTAKDAIALTITQNEGAPDFTRTLDLDQISYTQLADLPPIPDNADIDARINALVPLADVQATHAVTSFASSWDDRHSWTPHQIADYILNLRSGADDQHRSVFVPDAAGFPIGDVLAIVDNSGVHGWMPMPPSIIEPDAAGNLPLATTEYVGQFGREHNDLRIGRTVVTHPATTLAVGYAPIAASGSYRGVFYQGSDVGNPNNEDVIFSWRYGRFEAYNEFQSFWGIIANPTELPTNPPLPMVWRGDWGTQNEASEHVHAVGDVVYIDTRRPRALLRVTSYTPDAPEQRQNVWSPTDDILTLRQRADDLEARPQLPDTAGRSAGLSVVTAAGGGYTLSNIMGGGGGTPVDDNRLVPSGGSVGFYLGKTGAGDYETGWLNVNQSLTNEGIYNRLRQILLEPADGTVTLTEDSVAHTIRPSAAAPFDLNALPELPSTSVLSNPDKLLMADASDGNTMKSVTAAQAANHFQPNIQYGSVLVSSAAQIIEFTDDAVATALTPNHVRVTVDITAKAVNWLTTDQLTPNINHRFITYSPADANTIRYSTIDDLRTYMVDVWARPNTPTIPVPEFKLPPIHFVGLADGPGEFSTAAAGDLVRVNASRTGLEYFTLPAPPADTNNYVTGGSVAGTTLTLTRQGLGDITIPGLPTGGGGTTDGVVTGGSVTGTTLTLTRSVGGDIVIPGLPAGGGGGGTPFVINTLPNLASSDIADHDVLAIEDNSMSWAQRSITIGELAARLADGTTITSSAGTLTAVGGGGGMAAAGETLLAQTTAVAYTPNASTVLGHSFARALTVDDDDRTMVISVTWTDSNDSKNLSYSFYHRAGDFRLLEDQGTTTPTTLDGHSSHYITRPGNTALNAFAEGRMMFWRGTDAGGNTSLFYCVGGRQNNAVMNDLQFTVRLLPQGGGGGAATPPFNLFNDVPTAANVRGDSRLVFADLSRADRPNRYVEAGALLDDLFEIAQTRTQVTNVQPNDQFFMWDVGGAQVREVEFSTIQAQLNLMTGITVNTLPNLPSGEIADHDVLLIEDNSESWEQKHISIGELAARLADGVTITSNAGTLTSVGGGGGGGDNTLPVLTEVLNGDGTDDLALVTPNAGGATQQDYMLIYDRSTGALARTGLGDLAATIGANPFAGSTFYTADVAPGDAVLMRDISLGVNHSLSLEHLYGQMFTIAALHQTAPAADDQIVILDVSSNILRHVTWSQFNQGGGGGLTQAEVDARILNQLPTPSDFQAGLHQAGQVVEGATWETRFGWTPQRIQTAISRWASAGGGATNSYVIPDGGTDGQVLAKASNANRDLEWISLPPIPADTNNYVTGGSVTGTTLTLTRQGLGDITIPGLPTGGGGTADGVVTGGSVSGTTLTLMRSVGADITIPGLPSGGGGGDSITELYSGTFQLTTNLRELGAGVDCPSTGYVRVYVEAAGNREGAVGSAVFPAARLLAAQKAINSTWSADDADQRTVPIGANRSVSFATNSDAANNNILIAAQDTGGSGDFHVIVEHVVPGAGGGSGTTFDISTLPNLASSAVASHDQYAIYDVSESEHKHLTHGSLAAALADGTTITSNDGVLSAVGGMGGGLTQAQVLALIADPAEQGNTDRWPEDKMTGIPTSFIGQSWNADDTRLTLGLNRSGGLSAITRDIDIPTRYRIPGGGTDGQALVKASGTDYDYEWATVGGGMGVTPRTDEEIRDVSAAQLFAGDRIHIFKDDPNNRVTISADDQFENARVLVFVSNNGPLAIGNRDRPADSFAIGSVDMPTNPNFVDAAELGGFVYFLNYDTTFNTTSLYRAAPEDLTDTTFIGNMIGVPTDPDSLFTDGATLYAFFTQGGGASQVWEVNTTNPEASTLVSTNNNAALNAAMARINAIGYHNGNFYAIENVDSDLYLFNPTNLGASSLIGRIGQSSAWNGMVSVGGVLYAVSSHTNPRSLWIIDPETPASSRLLGAVAATTDVQGLASATLPLTTTLVPEGTNLYFTDNRVRDYLNARGDYAGGHILSAVFANQDPIWIESWWAGTAGAANADYEAGQHVVAHGRPYIAVADVSNINADGIVEAARGVHTNNAHNNSFRLVDGFNDNLDDLGTPASGDFLALVDISDGFALKRITFDDFTAALNIPDTTGISQTDADARYLQLTGGTLTSALTVEQDSGSTALTIERQATAGNTALQAIDDGDARAWIQLQRNVGGTELNPGFAVGPGGSGARDVNLYRRDPNVWKTDDTFDAANYEIGGVNLLASITGADPHLPFLLADLEVLTDKEWDDSQFATTFGIHMSRDDHSTVAAVDGLTYNIVHNTGNLTNFFGWWIYGRIPLQRTVGGDTFDTDWHDYRVYAAETNPPHEYPRTYATWIEIGTDATYRYARINLNHALQNFTYQAQADLDRVTGTEYHGLIANQRSGGDGVNIWIGTEAQYNAIATKDPNTLYFRTA